MSVLKTCPLVSLFTDTLMFLKSQSTHSSMFYLRSLLLHPFLLLHCLAKSQSPFMCNYRVPNEFFRKKNFFKSEYCLNSFVL